MFWNIRCYRSTLPKVHVRQLSGGVQLLSSCQEICDACVVCDAEAAKKKNKNIRKKDVLKKLNKLKKK